MTISIFFYPNKIIRKQNAIHIKIENHQKKTPAEINLRKAFFLMVLSKKDHICRTNRNIYTKSTNNCVVSQHTRKKGDYDSPPFHIHETLTLPFPVSSSQAWQPMRPKNQGTTRHTVPRSAYLRSLQAEHRQIHRPCSRTCFLPSGSCLNC